MVFWAGAVGVLAGDVDWLARFIGVAPDCAFPGHLRHVTLLCCARFVHRQSETDAGCQGFDAKITGNAKPVSYN